MCIHVYSNSGMAYSPVYYIHSTYPSMDIFLTGVSNHDTGHTCPIRAYIQHLSF